MHVVKSSEGGDRSTGIAKAYFGVVSPCGCLYCDNVYDGKEELCESNLTASLLPSQLGKGFLMGFLYLLLRINVSGSASCRDLYPYVTHKDAPWFEQGATG